MRHDVSSIETAEQEIREHARLFSAQLESVRAQIAALDREEHELRNLPVPRTEALERFNAWVDAAAAGYLNAERTRMHTWRDDLGGLFNWDKPGQPFQSRALSGDPAPFSLDAMAFWFGDTLKAKAVLAFEHGAGYLDGGLPAAERPTRLTALAAERTTLVELEERLVRASASAGVSIKRRPAVVEQLRQRAHERRAAIFALADRIRQNAAVLKSGGGGARAAHEWLAGMTDGTPARARLVELIAEDREAAAVVNDDLRLDLEARQAEYALRLRDVDAALQALAAETSSAARGRGPVPSPYLQRERAGLGADAGARTAAEPAGVTRIER